HREAGIPSQCYTKTEGTSNPCWACHTDVHFPNVMSDSDLQSEYSFSAEGKENHWTNLFVDGSAIQAELSDAWTLAYVRSDNYAPLRRELRKRSDYVGYVPDLDFTLGFDAQGFARDGSGWRALRYKPFPGVFWPTNGNSDDVMVRLAPRFRSLAGRPSLEVYRANLALLEASLASDPRIENARVRRSVEPIDERAVGYDLNGDGKLEASVHEVVGIPDHYLGDASDVRLRRNLYPEETEFLHSVRYLDPDAPSFLATRMKELRYMKKIQDLEESQLLGVYAREHDEKDEGHLPFYPGAAETGLRNRHGWTLQGFIEDREGRLRLQTHQEQAACMGCHTNLGVTVDQTFAFARKLPGAAGWAYQDLRGMADAPQLGHAKSEFSTYLERVGGGDEFRANAELLERFFVDGKPNTALIARAQRGGDRDFAWLVLPSRERALELDRAYVALVRAQVFERGRDAQVKPPARVHRTIENESTGLGEAGRVYLDGRLRLAWDE
ncbi:MAG TPA: hypothetical protein VLC09_01530, partial [Polyangiaceae bacterium]|nr:hypothetical protein [Polyangiaceae bacterium]